MSEQLPSEEKLWRISFGMQQRTVRAESPFEAARKCGLGSGDLLRAEIELLDDTGAVISTAVIYTGELINV